MSEICVITMLTTGLGFLMGAAIGFCTMLLWLSWLGRKKERPRGGMLK